MSRCVTIGLLMLAVAFGQTLAVSANHTSKDLAARIEAIPVQTLTITDEQFLKGDEYGRPTSIAGVLRIAQGSGRLPAVILVHGSGGFNANIDLWDQQLGPFCDGFFCRSRNSEYRRRSVATWSAKYDPRSLTEPVLPGVPPAGRS
jgi:hypothetical protein